MKRSLPVFLLGLFVLSACSLYGSRPGLNRRIHPSLHPGDTFAVNVKYWPERVTDPYVEGDTPLESTNTYSVLDSTGPNGEPRILIRNQTHSFLMTLTTGGNVLSVDRIVNRTGSDLVKTQEVLSNKLQNRALFDPVWSPSGPVFLFHPDMIMNGSRARFRFDRGSNRSGDWVTQSVNSEGSHFRITLRHRPSESRVDFHWDPEEPWWKQARWYRSERLIAQAKRVRSVQSQR